MSSRHQINKGLLFFWFLLLTGIWILVRSLPKGSDDIVFSTAAHTLGTVPTSKPLYLLQAGETAPLEPDTFTETRTTVYPTVGMISLDDASVRACFAALPLGPQDLAVLINNLSSSGVRALGISTPLNWDQPASHIAQQLICLALNGFNHTTIGLRGRTASQADFTPSMLRQISIPSDQVEGDTSGLPSANKAVPNDLLYASEAARLTWAPDWLEDEPLTQKTTATEDRSFPLLVRWNGEILPTLPLILALQVTGQNISDVYVHMGKEIRIGSRVFPLDAQGRTKLKDIRTIDIPLSELASGSSPSLKKLGGMGLAILAQPEINQQDNSRLNLLAATLSQLCSQEKIHKHRVAGAPSASLQFISPFTGWVSNSIAALILLITLRFLPTLPSLLRKIIILAIPCYLLFHVHRGVHEGYWFPFSSSILMWVALVFALYFLKPVNKRTLRRR